MANEKTAEPEQNQQSPTEKKSGGPKPPTLDELKTRLACTTDGLSNDDAAKRVQEYGYNEIPEDKVNPVLKFLSYFWGPIPWMIEAAAILSASVRDWTDFWIILLLLFGNVIVGFWEEYQAGNAIAALKKEMALEARALRDGTWSKVPARELVPGDVVRLRLGDIVPADALVLEDQELQVDQSALTGESLPVTRNEGDALYSGSILKQGESQALVYATGVKTFFGKTVQLMKTGRNVSHFQQAVMKIGDYLIALAVALVALIFIVALFRNESAIETLKFALVLTVAAVPVAMPTVLSVTMAVGARLLAKKQAIVSRLASIEELAGMDVLCSDKTGTLTQNKLTLGEPYLAVDVSKDDVVCAAALASKAEDQDAIDQAILNGVKDPEALKSYTVRHFQPFDPVHKRTEATVESSDKKVFKVTKGAPQVILGLSANADAVKDGADAAIQDFAERGHRSLGVARTDSEDGEWTFLGVLPLFDPPRVDSRETVRTAEDDMGVRIKMVTGDQLPIAKEIAGQLGLGTNIMTADAFSDVKYHESRQFDKTVEQADGFAQVYPEHKFHIVEVLQHHNHIVGMTGDGVNDAPALNKADVGIAVSGATDAARAAADIVLLTPGLSVIVDALKESRKIFQRMSYYATYRIAETIRVLLFMTLSILIFKFYPVTPVMIVLLALLNDGAILSIAYDRTHYAKRPEVWNMPFVLSISTALGIVGVIETFGLFYLAERVFHLNRDLIQTLIYLKLSVAGHLTIFVTRTRGPFWSVAPAPVLLLAVMGTQIIATLLAGFGILMPAIGWKLPLLVWAYALVSFLIEDRVKLFIYSIIDPEGKGVLRARGAQAH